MVLGLRGGAGEQHARKNVRALRTGMWTPASGADGGGDPSNPAAGISNNRTLCSGATRSSTFRTSRVNLCHAVHLHALALAREALGEVGIDLGQLDSRGGPHNAAMAERVIPLVDQRLTALRAELPAQPFAPTGLVADRLGRLPARPAHQRDGPLQLPLQLLHAQGGVRQGHQYPHASLLSFEEITRVARQFLAHACKIR